MLVASPLASRWRSRFSTKIPWFGRAAWGNRVENVSSRTGTATVIADRAEPGSGAFRHVVQQLPRLDLFLEFALVARPRSPVASWLRPCCRVLQGNRVVVQDARIATRFRRWPGAAAPRRLCALPRRGQDPAQACRRSAGWAPERKPDAPAPAPARPCPAADTPRPGCSAPPRSCGFCFSTRSRYLAASSSFPVADADLGELLGRHQVVGVLAQPVQQQGVRVVGSSGPQHGARQPGDQQAGRSGAVGLGIGRDGIGGTVGRHVDVALQRLDAGKLAVLRLQAVGRRQRPRRCRWTSGRPGHSPGRADSCAGWRRSRR